jgi:hypothetical protein
VATAAFTIAGISIFQITLQLPRTGVWTLDCISSDPALTELIDGTAVTVQFGALTLQGTVATGSRTYGAENVRVVGGADGLPTATPASGWLNVPLVNVLQAILESVGESLSPTVTQASLPALYAPVPFWAVINEPAGTAISRIADYCSATWRVLLDGTIWMGVDTYPVQPLASTYTLKRQSPELRKELWGIDPPELLPAVTFNPPTGWSNDSIGGRVSVLTYTILPVGGDRENTTQLCEILYELGTSAPPNNRLVQPLADTITTLAREFDYLGSYPARVQYQSGGAVDVTPEAAWLPTLNGVPLKFGTPATTATFSRGARVYLRFENGSPAAPFIETYDPLVAGATGTVMYPDPATQENVARVNDTVGCGALAVTVAPAVPPPGVVITFTYTPQGGLPVVTAVTLTGIVTGAATNVPLPLSGVIATGSPNMKLGGVGAAD